MGSLLCVVLFDTVLLDSIKGNTNDSVDKKYWVS